MADDPVVHLEDVIDEHWMEMNRNGYSPALDREEAVHDLAESEWCDMDAYEIALFDAGVLRGLELARNEIHDMKSDE